VGEPLETLVTPDGRELAFATWGDPSGFPVLSLHGTPGCRLSRWPDEDVYRRLGVRVVTHDRAGYGRSTRRRGRSVADVVDDVVALADHLGLERFGVTGGSGGGPHALACAALLGDRVAAAATLCGVGPYGADGLDFLAGMGDDNVIEFEAALAGPEQLAPLLEELAPQLLDASAAELVEALRSLLSPPDVAVVHDGLASELIAATGEGIRASRAGWLDDDLAFAKPWGFELGSISVPVQLWQGRQDLMVPAAHGEWLAEHIPAVDARLSEDDGHLSIEQRRIGDAHAWLLERY
jgi:pimeloyl-ACP methyl ester carboxylesterase